MAATMFLCGWLNGKYVADRKRDGRGFGGRSRGVVLHDYKTSTNYHRLYQLLIEGRHIIRIKRYSDGDFVTYDMTKRDIYYKDGFTFAGMGESIEDFNNISEEDFINYCKWKKLEYLDQI